MYTAFAPKSNTCNDFPTEKWYTRGADVPIFGEGNRYKYRFGVQRPSEVALQGSCRPTPPPGRKQPLGWGREPQDKAGGSGGRKTPSKFHKRNLSSQPKHKRLAAGAGRGGPTSPSS